MGDEEGTSLGLADAVTVGAALGLLVGSSEGECVGGEEGASLGLADAVTVGAALGLLVGSVVGPAEG